MATTLPGFLLTDTVTLEPYLGVTTAGVQWGPAQTLAAHVQERRKLIRMDGGYDAAATLHVFMRLGPAVTVGDRVTVRGELASAVAVAHHDGRGLPVPSHIDVWCETASFLPSTTVTVRRGETTDAYGDVADAATVVASGLPAQIVETGQRRFRPVDLRGGVVEQHTIRLRSTARILDGDRILDDRSGAVYQAVAVTYPHTTLGPSLGSDDVRVVAVRVGAASLPPI